MIILDIIICILLLFFGLKLKNSFRILSNKDKRILDRLFLFHITVGVIFYFYILTRGDAVFYWMHPKDLSSADLWDIISNRGYASDYIYLLNYLPSNVLGLSFFTGCMIYCVLGYSGLLYFYLILKNLVPELHYLRRVKFLNISIFPFLLFLPNLHFWSSGVGKDTLLFFCIALFTYSLMSLKRRFFGVVISILLSIFVRPHITLFLIIGFGLGYFFDSRLKTYQRILMIIVFCAVFAAMFGYVMAFVNLDSLDSTSIEQYSASKSGSLASSANSGVDISGYPYWLKIFTFLYRPLFFDMGGPVAIIASFENLIMLLFTWKLLKSDLVSGFKNGNYILKGMFFVCLLGIASFSLILGNLGIMMREKNMFTPLFIIFAFGIMAKNLQKKRKRIEI